jgi:hypothetical protein
MTGKQLLCAMALLGGVALMSASSASAQTVPLPNAYTFLGMVGNQAKLVSQDPNNPAICATRNVGGIGGLNANTTIFGTSTSDAIFMASGPTTHCGVNMNTLQTNGFSLTIRAGAQGDWMDSGAYALITLVGDGGADIIVHPAFSGSLWGGPGDDLMLGSTNDSFFGEDGNDKMCAAPATNVAQFNGGNGTDYHCGIPAFLWSSTLDCSKC